MWSGGRQRFRKASMNRRRFLIAVLAVPAVRAHKFHFTSTLLDYSPSTKTYQLTVRLFADDIEAAIARLAGRRVAVDRQLESEPLVFSYLKDNLAMRGPDMKEIPLTWVGLEVKVSTVYAYLEAPAPESGLVDLAIRNTIFFDLLPGQVNAVILRDPVHGRPADLTFRAGDRFKVVIFPDPEEA